MKQALFGRAASDTQRAPFHRNRFLFALAVYFILQIIIRLSLSDSLDLDEAEQVFIYQNPGLGYGTQPPLYAWLQWLMFSVFGLNLFALSLLKNLLLFVTYLGMFYLALPLIGATGAAAASASLLLLPAIGWESQRDLTHSVLLTCLACTSLWCYFSLLRRPTALRYALFGALLGLGILAKYNFAVFIIGLTAASLLVPTHRQILWNRKVWIAIVVATLCLLPHALWLMNNLSAAVDGTLHKMSEGEQGSYLYDVASGLGSMTLAALAFITPLWMIYGWICRRNWRSAKIDRTNPDARFFLMFYASCFVVLTLLVLSGEVSYIKSRWILPLLFSVPLAFFLVLPTLSQEGIHRRVLRAAGIFALLILLALPGRVYLGAALGKHVRAHQPYPQLADAIEKKFPQARTLIVDTKLIGGNLHFQRPEMRTVLLDEALGDPALMPKDAVLIVRNDRLDEALEELRSAYPRINLKQRGHFVLVMRYGSNESLTFQFAQLLIPNT